MSNIDIFLTNLSTNNDNQLAEITKLSSKAPASAGRPIVNMFLNKHFKDLKLEDVVYSEDKVEIASILEDDYLFEVDEILLNRIVSIFKITDTIFVIRVNRID